jgi:hypothetical protein
MPAISSWRVDQSMKNKITKRCSPRGIQVSMVQESAAAIRSQCCVRNSFRVVFPAPLRRRLDAVSVKNICDRAASHVVPQVEKGTLHPRIAPSAVFFRHLHYECLDLFGFAGPRRWTVSATVVVLRDPSAVPGP